MLVSFESLAYIIYIYITMIYMYMYAIYIAIQRVSCLYSLAHRMDRDSISSVLEH